MSLRKFENNELAVVNSKIGQWDRTHYNANPGTEVTIVSYDSYGFYSIKTSEGKVFKVKPNVLNKTKGKSSINKFQSLIEQAKEKIEKTQAFIVETEAKIEFLKEIKSDLFDENEFKAYHTLTIIEQGNMSKIEKAKAIAALISKK